MAPMVDMLNEVLMGSGASSQSSASNCQKFDHDMILRIDVHRKNMTLQVRGQSQ